MRLIYVSYFRASTPHLLFSVHWSVVGLCVNCLSLQEVSLFAVNYEYSNKLFEVILILCPFSRILLTSLPLGPIASSYRFLAPITMPVIGFHCMQWALNAIRGWLVTLRIFMPLLHSRHISQVSCYFSSWDSLLRKIDDYFSPPVVCIPLSYESSEQGWCFPVSIHLISPCPCFMIQICVIFSNRVLH